MTDSPVKTEITKETFNPKLHVAEYKRTCNSCGKVWHSLIDREAKLNPNASCCDQDALGELNTCGTNSAQAQYRRNIQSRENSLSKLRQCPMCGSNNYAETIIYYEKK